MSLQHFTCQTLTLQGSNRGHELSLKVLQCSQNLASARNAHKLSWCLFACAHIFLPVLACSMFSGGSFLKVLFAGHLIGCGKK